MKKISIALLLMFIMGAEARADYIDPVTSKDAVESIRKILDSGRNVVVLFSADAGPDGENEWHADFYSFMNESGDHTDFVELSLSQAKEIFGRSDIPRSDVSALFLKREKRGLYSAAPVSQEVFSYARAYFENKETQIEPEELGLPHATKSTELPARLGLRFLDIKVEGERLIIRDSNAHAAELSKQLIAGSYEILICKGSCAAAGDQNVMVTGRLVLFPEEMQQQELDELRLPVRHMYGQTPNACFGLERRLDRDYHGYAGGESAGFTAWSIENGELRFSLYHSPDAGYRVTVQRAPHGFAGTGKSWGAGVAAPRESTPDQVFLRRTGAANLSQCPRQED